VAGLALSMSQAAFAQINNASQTPTNVNHPSSGFFPIAEAYFAAEGPAFLDAERPSSFGRAIFRNREWCGEPTGDIPSAVVLTRAHPGIFALKSRPRNVNNDNRQLLDVNCFAVPRTNEDPNSLVIQSVRLTKDTAASQKCPTTFQARTFRHFGTGIRTWWTLIYTAPGTRFTLEVTVRAIGSDPSTNLGKIVFHTDRWIWQVVVTFETLEAVIDVLHSNSLATSELPCIFAEEVYSALRAHLLRLNQSTPPRGFVAPIDTTARRDAQDRLFQLEALIVAFCMMDVCFDPDEIFGTGAQGSFQPPSNDVQTIMGMMVGIIDTFENPCCCKLLVDVEKLGELYNITSGI
jgi:hypothetical protein